MLPGVVIGAAIGYMVGKQPSFVAFAKTVKQRKKWSAGFITNGPQ